MANPALLIVLALIGPISCNQPPRFSWDGSRSSEYGVPHLVITFPDGQSDVALLERHNPIPVSGNEREMDVDTCIFRGKLIKNPRIPIAVTGGCPFSDSFEISIFSDKLSHNIYKVENGVATGLELPRSDYVKASRGSHRRVAMEDTRKLAIDRALPASGFLATVKLFYDPVFRDNFDVTNTLRRVMTHTQAFYDLADSLTTTLTLTILEATEIPETVLATSASLNLVSKHSTDPDVHFNVYMGYEYNNQKGFVGLAWPAVACSEVPQYRTSVNEYYFTDAQTGGVVAHEMGHNLGMYHDFYNNGPRNDYYGQPCTGIGGIMDYSYQVKWSTCSVQDFLSYFNEFTSFCIPLNNKPVPTKPPTTVVDCIWDLATDRYCDDEYNNAQCNYDGGACCDNTNPNYKQYCTACKCIRP